MHTFTLPQHPGLAIHHNGDYSGDMLVTAADELAEDGVVEREVTYDRIHQLAIAGEDMYLSHSHYATAAFLREFIGSSIIDRKISELEDMDYADAFRTFVLDEDTPTSS